MTTDFGVIDLKEQPYAPLILHPSHRRNLITAITQILVASGADSAALLSTYTPETVVWELPPLRGEDLMGVGLSLQPAPRDMRDTRDILACYKEMIKAVTIDGFGPKAEEVLESKFGTRTLHPMVFTRSAECPGALPLFGIEWACFLQPYAEKVVIQSNHVCVKMDNDLYVPMMGLVDGKCCSDQVVTEDFINECLDRERGFVIFDTFDALDRAHLWVSRNQEMLAEPKKLLRGLCLLKLSQNPRVAYSFEQALRNLRPRAKIEPTLKSLIYSDAALDMIRDIWYDESRQGKEKFDMLHQQLVPSYLDDGQFKTLFKHMPASVKRVSLKVEKDINQGLEKFVALFLQTRRSIAEGKTVKMES